MPPKTKITQQAILNAAYEMTRKKGIAAVTAKAVSSRLHCSTQPVYWVYGTMDKLREAVIQKAAQEYLQRQKENICKPENTDDRMRYRASGLNYIEFAATEPELFKVLFMSNRDGQTSLFSSELDGNKDGLVKLIQGTTGLDEEKANKFYVSNWIVSHGIATMLVTHTAVLSQTQIEEILRNTYRGTLTMLQSE